MKKSIFFLLYLLVVFASSAEIPSEIKGIWKGDDRYIFIGEENQFAVILKEYYGWYYDRVVEPENFSNISARKRNISTQKNAHHYTVDFKKNSENIPVWEMTVNVDKKTKSIIPIALTENEIYLKFLIKIPYSADSSKGSLTTENDERADGQFANSNYGYWQGVNESDSIRISGRNNSKDIISWYMTENGNYRLRFWQTDMLYEDSKAAFSDENKLYTVNKHIFSAGQNYSCVNGRSSNIRNVEKYPDFPFSSKLDSTGNLLLPEKPYLTKVTDKNSAEELMKIVEEANKQRKPDPPPLFPAEDLDWHWDLINQLEKGNKIIEKVRERQKKFGPRAQDIEKKK